MIPWRANLALGLLVPAACIGFLRVASDSGQPWTIRIACAIAFALANNTNFALLHEAVHGILLPDRRANRLGGIWLAAFFPTGFTFQTLCHLGHHRRNRTDDEMFDLYYPEDNLLFKRLQIWWLLTGCYWSVAPLGCLAYLLAPGILSSPLLRDRRNPSIRAIGADGMLSAFRLAPALPIRLEILFSIGVQAALFTVCGVGLAGWLLCYGAFAIAWCSLQYTDHAFSKRDIVEGAWNLRVWAPIRWIFLNYHHHAVHHRHPKIPWTELGKHIDPTEPRPSFLEIYLRLWKGPVPATEPEPRLRPGSPILSELEPN